VTNRLRGWLWLLLWSGLSSLAALSGTRFFHFENAGRDEALVRELQPRLLKRVEAYHQQLGVYPADTLRIIIARNLSDYRAMNNHAKGIIEFSAATYSFADRTIRMQAPRELNSYGRLSDILFHEYLHAQVDKLWPDAPLWFHEGVAVYYSEGISAERMARFAWNGLFGIRRPLAEMESEYPKNPGEWEAFYTQSALAVRFLKSHREAAYYRLWDSGGKGRSFEGCFYRSFGESTREFSMDYERVLKQEVMLMVLLAASSLLWGVLPIILLLAWLKRKIWSDPKVIRIWEAEEKDEEIDRPEDVFRPYYHRGHRQGYNDPED
jgi:hypothetical protein